MSKPMECIFRFMARDLAELQDEVIAAGYTRDFGDSSRLLAEADGAELRIVRSIFFDGGTDPGDDATLYLIEAPSDKGYLIISNSFHADPKKAAFLDALISRAKPDRS